MGVRTRSHSPLSWTCAECDTPNRLLKYARGTMCCKYRCQRAAHDIVVARKAGAAKGDGNVKPKAATTFCYKIESVHGQQDFVGAKRRSKPADEDMNVCYLIHGMFRENAKDVRFHDTRWVELTDLLEMPGAEQKKLVAFEKKLEARMQARKQRMASADADTSCGRREEENFSGRQRVSSRMHGSQSLSLATLREIAATLGPPRRELSNGTPVAFQLPGVLRLHVTH